MDGACAQLEEEGQPIARFDLQGWRSAVALERGRPARALPPRTGQHHLNRAMRLENQRGAFICPRRATPREARRHPVLLVDDILTSGATALNAEAALRQAGWRVHGLICLARTPSRPYANSGDLRCQGRAGDRPG
jgi:hypothetical protein